MRMKIKNGDLFIYDRKQQQKIESKQSMMKCVHTVFTSGSRCKKKITLSLIVST